MINLSNSSSDTHRCPVCESLFFPKRNDAIYCSASCRQRARRGKYNRARSEQQSIYAQVVSAVNRLRGYSAHRQLRIVAMSIIQELPDDERLKLYEAIEEDMNRVKRDKIVTDKAGGGHE